MATQTTTILRNLSVTPHSTDHSRAAAFPIPSDQHSRFCSVALIRKPINWSKLRLRASYSQSLQKKITPVIKSHKVPHPTAMTLAAAALINVSEYSASKVARLPEPLLWSPELFAEIKEGGVAPVHHAPPLNAAAEGRMVIFGPSNMLATFSHVLGALASSILEAFSVLGALRRSSLKTDMRI